MMNIDELKMYLADYTKPSVVDIEMAKNAILEELSSSPLVDMPYAEAYSIMSRVITKFRVEPFSVPAGFLEITPNPNQIKAELAFMEAIHILHATGSLIAFGSSRQDIEAIRFSVRHHYGGEGVGEVYRPAMYFAYRLAIPFQGSQRFRLASADLYMSHLNQNRLPSRARRCLRESVEAFRKNLYLSATIAVGAASESLWMSFGQLLLRKKLSGCLQLEKAFKNAYPNISDVIKACWDIQRSECIDEIKLIFPTKGEQDAFKEFADRLLERRNYAIHSQDADEDEPLFTYEETGMLLLDAANYFNRLMDLMEAIDKKETRLLARSQEDL